MLILFSAKISWVKPYPKANTKRMKKDGASYRPNAYLFSKACSAWTHNSDYQWSRSFRMHGSNKTTSWCFPQIPPAMIFKSNRLKSINRRYPRLWRCRLKDHSVRCSHRANIYPLAHQSSQLLLRLISNYGSVRIEIDLKSKKRSVLTSVQATKVVTRVTVHLPLSLNQTGLLPINNKLIFTRSLPK